MYAEPCAFCAGFCGAKTKAGAACHYVRAKCPIRSHVKYRMEGKPACIRLPDQVRRSPLKQHKSAKVRLSGGAQPLEKMAMLSAKPLKHPTLCEVCDRTMYSAPCAFCAGKCGARTKSGSACQRLREECPVVQHSVFREYSRTEFRMWSKAQPEKRVRGERTHEGKPVAWRGPFYGRRTAREMSLPV